MNNIFNKITDLFAEKIDDGLRGSAKYLVTKYKDGKVVDKYVYLHEKDYRSWFNELTARDGWDWVSDCEVAFGDEKLIVEPVTLPDCYYFIGDLFRGDE